jgi:dGTPase
VRAGFLTRDGIEKWAEKNELDRGEGTSLGDLLEAIKRERIDAFAGKRIGNFIQAASLVPRVNFLSGETNRYRYAVEVESGAQAESKLFKKLAYEVVFLSPQLKQLEHKGSLMLRGLWDVLSTRYVAGESIDGQDFQLLPNEDVAELEGEASAAGRARLVCDYLANMTDGSAARMYRRLFEPGYGSIGDLVG